MKRNLRKTVVGIITGALILGLAGCGSASNKNASGKIVIKAETNGAPAPFIVSNDDGTLDGYDIAVLKALFELDSFKDYELDLSVSSSSLTDAQQGIIDFTVNNWSYNSDRAESYYFSYPYTKARYSFITQKGVSISTFEELHESGIPIFGSAGGNTTNAVERWNEANPDKAIEIYYSSEDLTAELTKIGEGAYVGLGDDPVWQAYENAYPELFEHLQYNHLTDEEAANITEHSTSHLLFGKTGAHSKEYQKLFSEGILELYKNGTLQKLSEQYIGTSTSVVPDESDFAYFN